MYALLAMAVIRLLLVIANGIFTVITLEAFQKRVGFREAAYIALINTIGNYFGPVLGGTGLRAVYLKKRHGFPISTFVGTVYAYYLVLFFATPILGLIGLYFIKINRGEFSWTVFAVFAISATITGLMLLVRKDFGQPRGNNRLIARFSDAWRSWLTIAQKPNLIRNIFLLALSLFVVETLLFYLEFILLGIPVGLPSLLVYSCLGVLSMLVNITPGAIGIRESIYIFSASVLGITNGQIVQLAALDRGITILVLALAYAYVQISKKYTAYVEVS